MSSQLVKDFIVDSFQLVSASSPTVPLHGNDSLKGIQFLNELLNYYSSTGLLLPIPIRQTVFIPSGQEFVTAGPAFEADGITPTTYDIRTGRLAEVQNMFLTRDNVDYPLVEFNRYEFDSSYKFAPLQALPLYYILRQQIDFSQIQLYPRPDTGFNVTVNAKQQFPELTELDTMAIVPQFYIRFLRFAVAKDIAIYKGRSSAWTDLLEKMYIEAKKKMEGAAEFNLNIESDPDNFLRGASRIKAGV